MPHFFWTLVPPPSGTLPPLQMAWPPVWLSASTRITDEPPSRATMAAVVPLAPEPMTTTSASRSHLMALVCACAGPDSPAAAMPAAMPAPPVSKSRRLIVMMSLPRNSPTYFRCRVSYPRWPVAVEAFDGRYAIAGLRVGRAGSGSNRPKRASAGLALDSAPADVVAAEALGPADARDSLVGARLRLQHVNAERADIEHPTAIGEDFAAFGLGAGMEDFDALDRGRVVEALDDRAAFVSARITFGGHHHGECRLRIPAQIKRFELAVAARQQCGHQVRHQPQHQYLALGIAEADVVFDQLRPFVCDHQPSIQYALVGCAHRLHRPQGRHDDLGHDAGAHRVIDIRRRRIGAHAAGIRTLVAVKGAFVVLRGRERDGVFAVAQREERGFFALQKLLDDDFGAGLADAAAEHHVDRGLGFGHGFSDDHPLAGGKAVGLDDDRRALRAHISFGWLRGAEAFVGRCRDSVGAAQILGEAFGAFEPRRCACRTERLDTGSL